MITIEQLNEIAFSDNTDSMTFIVSVVTTIMFCLGLVLLMATFISWECSSSAARALAVLLLPLPTWYYMLYKKHLKD